MEDFIFPAMLRSKLQSVEDLKVESHDSLIDHRNETQQLGFVLTCCCLFVGHRVFVCVGLQFCIVALYHNAHCAYKSFLLCGQETVDGSKPARA